MRIGIVGLGLGGATAAAAMSQDGHDVTVFEQAPAIEEVGAGLALGPNAVRLLRGLGLGSRMAERGCVRSGEGLMNRVGTLLQSVTAEGGDGTPGYYFHRAELLTTICELLDLERVRLGRRCTSAEESDDGVRVRFDDGSYENVDLLVGADGLRSVVLSSFFPATPLEYANLVAYRGLVPNTVAHRHGVWADGEKYFVVYPVSGGRLLNFVGVVPTAGRPDESWSSEATVADLRAEFIDWDAPVLSVIDRVSRTFRWSLYTRAPLEHVTGRRVALLGDAAHPLLVHGGQGAGQAIEDAVALGVLLRSASSSDVPERLALYERLRLPRVTAVQQAVRRTARLLHRDVLLVEGEEQPRASRGHRLDRGLRRGPRGAGPPAPHHAVPQSPTVHE